MTHARARLPLLVCAALATCLLPAHRAGAQAAPPAGEFPGVSRALTTEQFEAAGMGKLSADERAKLDTFLRGYFAGETQRVVAQTTTKVTAEVSAKAVDEAVKQNKVRPPELIESRIIGKVNGWKSGQIITLENGQRWKITEDRDRYFTTITDPEVFLVKDFLSYKMAVAGGGVARVTRVQ